MKDGCYLPMEQGASSLLEASAHLPAGGGEPKVRHRDPLLCAYQASGHPPGDVDCDSMGEGPPLGQPPAPCPDTDPKASPQHSKRMSTRMLWGQQSDGSPSPGSSTGEWVGRKRLEKEISLPR